MNGCGTEKVLSYAERRSRNTWTWTLMKIITHRFFCGRSLRKELLKPVSSSQTGDETGELKERRRALIEEVFDERTSQAPRSTRSLLLHQKIFKGKSERRRSKEGGGCDEAEVVGWV